MTELMYLSLKETTSRDYRPLLCIFFAISTDLSPDKQAKMFSMMITNSHSFSVAFFRKSPLPALIHNTDSRLPHEFGN